MGGSAVSWSDVPGHVSYVLIALSYWMTNVFWLRIIAVIGLVFEIFYLSSGDMHTGIGWDAIFIIINLYQIFRLVYDQRRLRYMKELHLLSQGAFASLSREQLAQLVKVGSWRTLEPGTQVTREGEPVKELILICDGQMVVVLRAGRLPVCMAALWSANLRSCQVTRHRRQ
jgi:hypothetical protein